MGRPSVPPECLLKAQLLIALYSVRSDRMFCEMLDYNILFRWFLGMNMEEASIYATTFTKNRKGIKVKTLGADKGYDVKGFVATNILSCANIKRGIFFYTDFFSNLLVVN